ncbi:MAG: prepilin-type N-terminal cleavage/methylation domain-containing protein [Rhodoglobus sp.]
MIQSMNKAMTKRRDAVMAGENEKGFTLIELMVVIIIIGILAAIAIPVFLNQRQQAWDASVKSDLATIAIAAESYATANNGSYTGMTLGPLASPTAGSLRTAYSVKTTPKNVFTMTVASGTSYTVTAYNTNDVSTIRGYTLTNGTVTGPAVVTAITTSD